VITEVQANESKTIFITPGFEEAAAELYSKVDNCMLYGDCSSTNTNSGLIVYDITRNSPNLHTKSDTDYRRREHSKPTNKSSFNFFLTTYPLLFN